MSDKEALISLAGSCLFSLPYFSLPLCTYIIPGQVVNDPLFLKCMRFLQHEIAPNRAIFLLLLATPPFSYPRASSSVPTAAHHPERHHHWVLHIKDQHSSFCPRV